MRIADYLSEQQIPFESLPHPPAFSAQKLAKYLRLWATKINMEKIKKAPPRKPTKEKTKRIKDKSPHLSTARLLDEAKKSRQTKTNSRN